MRKAKWSLVCLAILMVGAVATFASDGNSPVRADIPFAFNVQSVSYAPGTYTIYQEGGFLHVRNEKDRSEKAFLALPQNGKAAKSGSELSFTDVDGTRYLTSVSGGGRDASVQVAHGKKAADQMVTAAGSR